MPLDAETILEIKKAVKEALAEEHDEFYVPRKSHFLDHQFISNVQENFGTAKKAGLWTASVSLISFLIGAIIWAMTQGYHPK